MNTEPSTTLDMEVFRAGDYGAKGAYSQADLDALAADYAPGELEAPLTLDHAQSGPAYGWVRALRRSGDRLIATVTGVPGALRRLIAAGAYKNRSIELIRCAARTGRPYLRAVSLLGAATPEVAGLREIAFAASAGTDHVIRFDFASHGAEAAGRLAPYESPDEPGVDWPDDPAPDTDPGTDGDGDGDTRPLEELRAEFAAEIGQLRAAVANLRTTARLQEMESLLADLGREGIALPSAHVMALCDLAESLPPRRIRFGLQRLPVVRWLGLLLRQVAAACPAGELTADASAPVPFRRGEPAASISGRTDPVSVGLHEAALTLQRAEPGLAYADALTRAARR